MLFSAKQYKRSGGAVINEAVLRTKFRFMTAAVFCVVAAYFVYPQCTAQTLPEALARAYSSNPSLLSAQEQQRALDETYVQARTGWYPNLTASGIGYWSQVNEGTASSNGVVTNGAGAYKAVPASTSVQDNYGDIGISLIQPLYTGGKTSGQVDIAMANIESGREGFRQIESQVLLQVITSFLDVRRDREISRVRASNVSMSAAQLKEAAAKFQAGGATKPEVAQSKAQFEAAKAADAAAKAQLMNSDAEFVAVVGISPGDLEPPPALLGFPTSIDDALNIAERSNPIFRQAELKELASRANIVVAKSANRPSLSAQVSINYSAFLPYMPRNLDRQFVGEIIYSQALYTGGLNKSIINQAVAQNTADRIAIEAARRSMIQTVVQAWNSLAGLDASVKADKEQVNAAQIAYVGVNKQYQVSYATTLDVLTAQQELQNAELSLANAEHDLYLARANVLVAIGRLEACYLVGGVRIINLQVPFDKIKNGEFLPWLPLLQAIDRVFTPPTGH